MIYRTHSYATCQVFKLPFRGMLKKDEYALLWRHFCPKQEADLVLSCFHFFDAFRHMWLLAPSYLILENPVSCDSFDSAKFFQCKQMVIKKMYNTCNLHTRICSTHKAYVIDVFVEVLIFFYIFVLWPCNTWSLHVFLTLKKIINVLVLVKYLNFLKKINWLCISFAK